MNEVYAVLVNWLSECGEIAIFIALVDLGFGWLFRAFRGHSPI